MSLFKTPEEALEYCYKNAEDAWQKFLAKNETLINTFDPVSLELARRIFSIGYMDGSFFICDYFAKNLLAHANQSPVIDPIP